MGKTEDDRNLPANAAGTVDSSENNQRLGFCTGCIRRISGFLGLKCLLILIFSLAVVLSALFWLPPFRNGSDQNDSDLDPFKGHVIVASFNVKQPVTFLNENVVQLEKDIFYEMSYASIEVIILSTEPSAEPNTTRVVFGIDPDAKFSEISPLSLSFIRESFESLVTNQSSLELTKSLFGQPFLFEVLKFPGGITVVPPQSTFPLQNKQILFNFTINKFSISQIQMNFNALTSQLRDGLHLTPFENLHLSLSNSKGSTVFPPTTVLSSVMLRVGNTPPMPRLKQIAQTIKGSSSRNLGLNNTVFGKVKQVRLSSILQHSLHGGDAGGPSPSPSPLPHIHHHHHHHRHHHHNAHLAPVSSPVSSPERNPGARHKNAPPPTEFLPAPRKSPLPPKRSPFAQPPCHHGTKQSPRKSNGERHSNLSPRAAPDHPNHHVVLPPQHQSNSPVPSPARKTPSVPVSTPLPHVVFAHAQPPPKSESETRTPTKTPPSSHPLDSSSAGPQTMLWAAFFIPVAVMMFDV